VFLFRAAPFWFGWFLTFTISLIPRYLVRYWKTNYLENDMDLIRYVTKYDPDHDFENDPAFPGARERQRYQVPPANGPLSPTDDARLSAQLRRVQASADRHEHRARPSTQPRICV
jgi:hypothetical protein